MEEIKSLEILFMNENFCCVNKPAGWLSVTSRLGAKDPRPVVGRFLETQLSKRVWPCHRLDEDVSGVLLFALNASAHRIANDWFERQTIKKSYQALSSYQAASPSSELQVWTSLLAKGKKRAYEAPFGKKSITHVQFQRTVVVNSKEYFFWHLHPQTGRSHQLRFEMMKHHYPIVGDSLYGSEEKFFEAGIALRAFKLDFSGCDKYESLGLPSNIVVEWAAI